MRELTQQSTEGLDLVAMRDSLAKLIQGLGGVLKPDETQAARFVVGACIVKTASDHQKCA